MNRLTDIYKELVVTGHIYIDNDDILKTCKNVSSIRQKMGLPGQELDFIMKWKIHKKATVEWGYSLYKAKELDSRLVHFISKEPCQIFR